MGLSLFNKARLRSGLVSLRIDRHAALLWETDQLLKTVDENLAVSWVGDFWKRFAPMEKFPDQLSGFAMISLRQFFPPGPDEIAKNVACVEAAVAEHQRALIYYAWKKLGDPNEAEDVVQKAFLKLAIAPCPAVSMKANWLYTVCRHEIIRICKLKARIPEISEEQMKKVPIDETLFVTALVEKNERTQKLLGLVEALTPLEREAVMLYYFHGLSVREIAKRVGSSPEAVAQRLHSARRKLGKWLGEGDSL